MFLKIFVHVYTSDFFLYLKRVFKANFVNIWGFNKSVRSGWLKILLNSPGRIC